MRISDQIFKCSRTNLSSKQFFIAVCDYSKLAFNNFRIFSFFINKNLLIMYS